MCELLALLQLMALTYHRDRWPVVTLTHTPPPPPPIHPPTHTHIAMYKSYTWHLNKHGFTVLGWPFIHLTGTTQLLLPTVLYFDVPSSTRADIVVATKKVNEQDTKTFPKCYVGRNGKQNQQKLQLQRYKNIENVML